MEEGVFDLENRSFLRRTGPGHRCFKAGPPRIGGQEEKWAEGGAGTMSEGVHVIPVGSYSPPPEPYDLPSVSFLDFPFFLGTDCPNPRNFDI